MMKKKIQLNIIAFILFQFLISCKKDKPEKTISHSEPKIEFSIVFPDTVYRNEVYDGEIKYKSDYDTVIETFGNKEKNRYVRFIATKTNNVDYDYKHLKETVKDTFGARNNKSIPFYDFKFDKLGTYYIDGIINDIILIDLHKKDKDGEDLSRFLENEERVTHKVIVIEKPKGK
jgi:hypothetical protein